MKRTYSVTASWNRFCEWCTLFWCNKGFNMHSLEWAKRLNWYRPLIRWHIKEIILEDLLRSVALPCLMKRSAPWTGRLETTSASGDSPTSGAVLHWNLTRKGADYYQWRDIVDVSFDVGNHACSRLTDEFLCKLLRNHRSRALILSSVQVRHMLDDPLHEL